jgi:diadenosine tetraphosphate (Ap4A) HIT family hydrolase
MIAIAVLIVRMLRDCFKPRPRLEGELAGQTVPHVHVHVLPRREGDNLLINWDRSRIGDPVHANPVHLACVY